MKVLILRQSLHHGNLERLIVSTAAYLRQMGIAADILLLYNRNRAPLLGENPDTLPPTHGIIAEANTHGVSASQIVDTSKFSPEPLRTILQAVDNGGYDLIHTHDFKTNVLGLIAGRRSRIPVVATAHGYVQAIRRDELYRRLDLQALRACAHVICVSDALRTEIRAAGVSDGRLSLVYNGVASADVVARAQSGPRTLRRDLSIADHNLLVMAVGRLSAEKGHRYLLDAMHLVTQAQRNVRLIIVGDGPLRPALERQIAGLGLSDAIALLGFRSDAPSLIAQCDMLVMPSTSEALGNVILEAMALGKPTIVTTAGGMAEVVRNEETGLVVPLANPQALAQAMLRLASDPTLAQHMGEQGRARVESEFTVPRMAQGLAAVFQRVVRRA